MGGLIYFSSASGNTARFVARLGLPAQRIPVHPDDPLPEPSGPYVLISPTYADAELFGYSSLLDGPQRIARDGEVGELVEHLHVTVRRRALTVLRPPL